MGHGARQHFANTASPCLKGKQRRTCGGKARCLLQPGNGKIFPCSLKLKIKRKINALYFLAITQPKHVMAFFYLMRDVTTLIISRKPIFLKSSPFAVIMRSTPLESIVAARNRSNGVMRLFCFSTTRRVNVACVTLGKDIPNLYPQKVSRCVRRYGLSSLPEEFVAAERKIRRFRKYTIGYIYIDTLFSPKIAKKRFNGKIKDKVSKDIYWQTDKIWKPS